MSITFECLGRPKESSSRTCLNDVFDFHLSFNTNPDHLRYSKYYESIGLNKIGRPVFNKAILITSSGVYEFLFGLFLKFVMNNRVVHSIHDWVPHPGRRAFLVSTYNRLASVFFELSFYSKYQRDASNQPDASVHHLPVIFQQRLSGTTGSISSQKNKRLLMFGRSEEYKGFDYANQLALHCNGEYEIKIISKNLDESQFHPDVEILTEGLTDEELDREVQCSDLVLLPYKSATQSGVVVHAYSNFRPVAVAPIGGLVEYLYGPPCGLVLTMEPTEDIRRISRFLGEFTIDDLGDFIKAKYSNSW